MDKAVLLFVSVFCPLFPLSSLVAEENRRYHCGHCAIMARLQQQQLAAEAKGKAPNNQYAPDRLVDITHLKLDVLPDFEARTIAASAAIAFIPIAKPIRQWRLNAVDLDVKNVTSNHSIRATQVTEEYLEITFADPIVPGAESQVVIQYEAKPQKGLFFRTTGMGYPAGDTQLWTQGEPQDHRHWFPGHDYPNEKFTTEVICHVPEGMVALSNGRLLSQTTDEETGLVAFHWLQDKVHVNYLVSIAAGYFEKMEDKHRDVPIALYVPPSEKAQLANSFRDTVNIMEFLEEEIGVPYPWDKYYNVCALDFMFGGMENTSLTTLTVNTLFADASENLHSSRSLDAHEMAHQWFGDLVTCRDWSHLWLNEGFATYYSLLYDKHLLGDDFFKHGLYRNAQGIFRNDKDTIPIVYKGYANPMDQFSFRAYPKGGWVLHMLRSQLGETLYRQCVKTYLERHRFGTVVTQDLVEVFEELSGRSLSRFFDQWVYLSGYPELDIKYSWDELAGQVKLGVTQKQMTNEKRPLFHFSLPVKLVVGDTVHLETIEISQAREDFYLNLDAAPDIVRFDPELTVLAKIHFKPSDKMTEAQLNDTRDVIGRLLAIEQLIGRKPKKTVELLTKVLNEDGFFAVRQAAANGLASLRTPESFSALKDSLDQADARVRKTVVQSLSKFYSDDAFNALKGVADRETNPDIRAQAIKDLGAYAKPELREFLLRELGSDSYRHTIARNAIEAMRTQDDPFYVRPLLRHLEESESLFPSKGFSRALKTLAYLARREEEKEDVRKFLLGKADHPKGNVARSAMAALGELNDPRAIPVLATFVAADADSANGKEAQAAINRLRKNETGGAPAEVSRLRGQVQDLEKQLQGMSEEIKTLNARFKKAMERIRRDDQTVEAER